MKVRLKLQIQTINNAETKQPRTTAEPFRSSSFNATLDEEAANAFAHIIPCVIISEVTPDPELQHADGSGGGSHPQLPGQAQQDQCLSALRHSKGWHSRSF